MYECIVIEPQSAQVLDAEGPLDGALQLEYWQDPPGPRSERWSMSVGAASDASESLEVESETVAGSRVLASRDDAVSSPHTGPGSPMGEVENT